MSTCKIILFLSLSTLFTSIFSAVTQKPDLVIEIFRHGARSPMTTLFDPNPSYWGENLDQLTSVGMRMHYLLGVAIKSKYPDLLSSYNTDKVYIRSTNFPKTVMSSYSHMTGVYEGSGPNLGDISANTAVPPFSSPVVQERAAQLSNDYAIPNNTQPVQTQAIQDDPILVPFMACPMETQWSDANIADSETLDVFNDDLGDLVGYLQAEGLKVIRFNDLVLAGDNALSNKAQGIPIPGNADPNGQYYKDLAFGYQWYTLKKVFGTETQRSLYAVNLLSTIRDYMKGTQKGTNNLNFIFLSGHDTTLLSLLTVFGITDKDCLLANYRSDKAGDSLPYPECKYPEYASNLIFELYNTTEPYVTFLYNGVPVSFCGTTENTCTLEQFEAYIQKVTHSYTQKDFVEMCRLAENNGFPLKTNVLNIVLGLASLLFLLSL